MRRVVRQLNSHGITNQTFDPFMIRKNGLQYIHAPVAVDSSVLEDVTYAELHDSQLDNQRYLVKMIDGALLQFDYCFNHRALERHRLAFLPSPILDPFTDLQEEYLSGQSFLEVVGRQIMSVPIRIDYDFRPGVAKSMDHPVAHMTLGQYRHCRIPLSGPMRPSVFVNFIISHFYSVKGETDFPLDASSRSQFELTLSREEERTTHFRIAL